MRRVFRMVSALSAGAALVWGLAKSMRRRNKEANAPDSTGGSTQWPPRPEPVPEPEPEPEPEPVAEPVAELEPEPEPEPEPVADAPEPVAEAPVAEPAEDVVLKGVVIEDPAAFLAFVNDATEAQLEAAGIKGKPQNLLVEARPFESVDAIGATKGIGRRTLQSLNGAVS